MNSGLFMTVWIAAGLALFGLSGCEPSSDTQQREQQEKLSAESNMKAGMPGVSNFTEKKLMKMIIEMRDDPKLNTFTYITDLNGKLHLRCHSIGYGLPYATQYTNPMKYASLGAGITLPQADPNGLFSPPNAEGTWVLCQNPAKPSDLAPVYFEDRVTVSPFELGE